MADCFNCKHRHHMVCIPESRDCEKVYLLDNHDVFEVNKDKCDFYDQNDIVYDFSAMYGALRFTREIYDHSIKDDYESAKIRTFKFDPCTVVINGIIYDFDNKDNEFVEIKIIDNIYKDEHAYQDMHVINIRMTKRQMHTYTHQYCVTMITKTVVMRYVEETNTVVINGVGYLEEEK